MEVQEEALELEGVNPDFIQLRNDLTSEGEKRAEEDAAIRKALEDAITGMKGIDGIEVLHPDVNSTTIRHTNEIDRNDVREAYKITYDEQGHITTGTILYQPD